MTQRQARPFEGTDRFTVLQLLGRGGMGAVYAARDRQRGHVVALKTLGRFDARALARFKNEFRTLHDVDHPNLVSLYELFEHEGEWFFTMELLEGEDLLAHVRNAGGFDEARLRAALAQLATGLHALHGAGIVHRDVKPSNVLVTESGRAVLLDFGLVVQDERDPASIPEIVGTMAYMAPEQGLGLEVGPAADWYALGVTLYEALTGRLPHTGSTPVKTLLAKQALPPRPSERAEGIPEDLDALCMRLLAPERRERPRGSAVLAALGVPGEPAETEGEREATTFVGRARELATLSAALEASDAGPRVVLVEGESGLGKSTLAHYFASRLRRDQPDAVVLAGRCYERDSVAFKAFDGLVDALSSHLSRLPAAAVAALLPAEAGLLPRLFPVFGRVEPIAAATLEAEPDDPQELRRRGFGALRELLARLAERAPLVLLIDDLHWTDRDSLALLQELLDPHVGPRLLVVGTTRPVEAPRRDAILAAVGGVWHRTLSLAPLALEQAEALAAELLPREEPATIAAIAREAGGSPFFVEELARHVGGASEARSEPDALELDEVLWQRIAALPPTPRHVLELVCTASGQSTRARIAHAAGLDEQALFEATRSLRAAHLVRATGLRRDDTLEPYHDRVRDAVERHLDPRRRRLCHQRLARALAEDGGARLAPHALVGHTLAAGDQAGAAKHAEEAAKHARAATAFDRAADFYRMALDLGGHDAERARALRLELARALAEAGRGAESADAYEAAAEGADEATRRDCQRLAAEQLLISGHIERGVARLDDALEALGEPPLATPRRALFAVLWRRLGLRLRGLSWSERAPEEVPAEERARLQLIGASALGLSMVDAIRGAAFSARFAQLALRSGDPFEVARALGSEANMSSYQARFRRARRFMDALAELTERHPDEPYLQGWVAATRGGFAYFRGEFAECEAHMQAALAGFGRVRGATWERNNSNLFALFGLRYQGRLRELASQVAALQRDAERRGDLYMKVNLQRYGGHYGALLADRPEEAWENLERAIWPAPAETFHLQDWQRLEARCSILLYEGRAADGRERAEAELAALDGSLLTRIHTIRSSAAFIRGRLLLGSAPDEGERRAVRRLARGLARRGGFVAAFGALLRAGEAEQRGDREAAVEAYRAALAIAERHGMGFHRAVIQRRLAERLGGDEGRALRAASDTWMQAQGVVAPERMAQLLVPRPTRRLSAVGDALDGLGRETD